MTFQKLPLPNRARERVTALRIPAVWIKDSISLSFLCVPQNGDLAFMGFCNCGEEVKEGKV